MHDPNNAHPPQAKPRTAWKTVAIVLGLVVVGVVIARGVANRPAEMAQAPATDSAVHPLETATPVEKSNENVPIDVRFPARSERSADPVLAEFFALLESGRGTLHDARDFQGTLHKQERIGGVLGDPQELRVKMRREPRAVYLNWGSESGKEILWRHGQDDGKLLLHPGGWKGRLTPVVRIAPDHKLVQALTRRPVEKIGLWNMGHELHGRKSALHKSEISVTTSDCTGPDGRELQSFRILDSEQQGEEDYDHITVVFVDRLWKIAVGCEVYGWPESEDAEPPMLESYFYSDIEFNVGLSDRDFDPSNPEYGFAKPAKAEKPER